MKLNITKQSGIYTLTSEQILPISLDKAWDFFSKPTNLDKITPEEMGFTITNNPPNETYLGQIITYEIGILPMIKANWITEITHLVHKKYFVDEQRFGPYAMWHHEHHFEKVGEDKVKMTDIVNYKLPLGLLGDLFGGAIVKNKVQSIFQGRFSILDKLFPS
ncbi:SRPBCC family protein [Frigoriflavimonas asaccharolytica]|uniref:Ligand-binding SRPBCC domain-containing protein n=1 Tax=Frigoriflavimonas asaccharolytica TaxID=2735899 RepID=A0A8J8G5K0_9FLAO|nr:SRPBCC family protein [Frigoriflavimonas asaccharolytica]NRS91873.1 ligand-binding SRPBCC domain-containing protein [Frigoriflavimonas asaccharolytica]